MRHLRTIGLCFAVVAMLVLARVSPILGAPPGSSSTPSSSVGAAKKVSQLKEVNYFPARAGWTYMWTDFKPKVIDHDFARIHKLGANAVRIFVVTRAFGFPNVKPLMAQRLAKVIRLAAKHSLGVHMTLFGAWSDYADVSGSKAWAKKLLAPYRHDRRIAVVELQNEISPDRPAAVGWAKQMLPYIAKLLPGTLETVSTPSIPPYRFKAFTRDLRHDPPDFWDYHYYGPRASAYSTLLQIKRIASGRPLFIGETGFSTKGPKKAGLDAKQAHYFKAVFNAAAQLRLPWPAPWILYNFAQGAIPPSSTAQNPKAYDYGLFRVNGTRKRAANVVEGFFKKKR